MKLRWAVAVVATAAFGAVPALAAALRHQDAYGPTVSKIAFTSQADGQADIYTMNAAGKNLFNGSAEPRGLGSPHQQTRLGGSGSRASGPARRTSVAQVAYAEWEAF